MGIRPWATALFVAVALVSVSVSTTYASVTATGFPQWLKPVAEKTLNAVWSEIQVSDSGLGQVETLRIVAPKLLRGYGISSIEKKGQEVFVSFRSLETVEWDVKISFPKLTESGLKWFYDDVNGIEQELLSFVREIPLDGLGWADHSLREVIILAVNRRLAGWDPDILIKLDGAKATLQIGFTPRPPLILALDPVIDSGSIPIILQNRLKESILTGQSGLIGLPVAWSEQHKAEIEEEIQTFLLQRNTVERARARVNVDFSPEQISKLNASVESSKYSLYAWFAAYVGTDEKYGELGIHLGRRARIFPDWNVELYGEFLTELNDLDIETRWGLIWSPYDRIWVGAEYSTLDDDIWWRFVYQGGYNKPYFTWRYSDRSKHDWGIGWKVNQYFSLELHYDDRDDDSLSLKVINNL